MAAGWLVLLADAFARLGAQIAASSIFAANIYFWLQAGYFSPASHSLPLLHLWSLGVEEQFYIAWPIVVMLTATRRRFLGAAAAIGTASFVFSVVLVQHREMDFYSPLTRAWELMAGAVLAGFGRGRMAKPWVHDAAIGLGLATLVGCFMFFDSAAAYPSWRAALPVGSAMLIIGAGNDSRLGPAVLAARLPVYIGLISYPLYLWHWPLLVLVAAVKLLPLTLLERGLIVALSISAAAATFELVERPIRHRKSSSLQLRALAGGIAAIALAGIIVVRADGFAFRFPAELRAAADVRPDVTTRTGECLVDLTGRAEISDVCIESARPLIAVWGDSTAGSLMPGLRALQSQQHFGIAQLTAQSCMPVLADAPSATCLEHNRLVAQRIRDLRPDIVLLHGFGPLNAGWERTLEFLASETLRTVVLGPVPAWKRRMPDQLMNYYITHRSLLPDRSSSLVSNLWDDRLAEQVSAAHGAAYISAWQVFCEADGCLTRTPDGALTTFDTVHLSKEGSILLLRRISDRLLPVARQTDAP